MNFLAGIDGAIYANVIQGACNSVEFLRFFTEALQTVDPKTRRPIEEVGFFNNFAAHHGEAEQALCESLDLGMELLFLPVYSPDFSPVEFFSKLKTLAYAQIAIRTVYPRKQEFMDCYWSLFARSYK